MNELSEKVEPSPKDVLAWIAAAPRWFPSVEAARRGIPRDRLDRALMPLWQAGLIEAADWVKDQGQGLALTATGTEAANDPAMLNRLLAGETRPKPRPAPEVLTTFDRGEKARQAYYYPSPARITQALILINCLVFLTGAVLAVRAQTGRLNYLTGSDGATLFQLGAVTGEALLQGETWRLLSCGFVHIGLFHLLLNLFLLHSIGTLAENLWGRWRFLVIYLLSAGTAACLAMMLKPNVLLAGASGAIWGVMTSTGVWMYVHRQHFSAALVRDFARRLGFAVMLNTAVSLLPGISWAGHLGGALGGIASGLAVHMIRRGFPRRSLLGWLSLLAIPAAAGAALAITIPRSEAWAPLVHRVRLLERLRYLKALDPELSAVTPKAATDLLAETAKVRRVTDVYRMVKLEARARKLLEEVAQLRVKAGRTTAPSAAADLPEAVRAYADALAAFARTMIDFSRGTLNDVAELGTRRATVDEQWRKLHQSP